MTHAPMLSFPPAFISPQPMGRSIAGLRQFIGYPPVGIADRVWSLPSCPCLGLQVGLTRGSCCQIFGPCSPARARLCWELLVGVGTPLAKKWTISTGRSGSALNSPSASNWTCFLSFSSFCGEASYHHTQFLCCNLRSPMHQQSCSSGWDCGRLGRGTGTSWGLKGALSLP